MNRLARLTALAALLGAALLATCAAAADPAAVAPTVTKALADPAFAGRNADGTIGVWVWFTDKGLSGAALERALDQAQRDLNAHAATRRGKMRPDGAKDGRLVDATDLPVAAAYVDAVSATGARPRHESRWLNAASYDIAPGQLDAIAALPHVRKVTLIGRSLGLPAAAPAATPAAAPAADSPFDAQWSVDYGGNLADVQQINVPALHDAGFHGQGVIIGMLDSGFRTTHECLSPLPVLARWDFVNNDGVVENEPGDPSDQDDHGTMTMSTIAGYAPGHHVGPAYGATMVLGKTEDTSQEVPAEEDNWVAGIEWLDTFGVDVVSSSLGYIDWYTFPDMNGNTAACTIAADLAVGKGIVVCNSAGNERGTSWNHIVTPADGDSVITAGAVTSSGAIASFSSPGPTYDGRIKPDVCALGSSNHVALTGSVSSYTTASGTSFSCPLTAGVAALVLSRVPTLTPMQVREAMRATASRAATPNNDFGWGILDAYAAAFYYGATFTHAPLGDTEVTGVPYAITATITDRLALDTGALWLYWRAGGGAWQQVALASTGGNGYAAQIPAQPAGTDVDYYLSAGDAGGITTTAPAGAPAALYSFHVGPDTELPVIAHAALGDQPLLTWPALVSATVTDNLGVAGVTVAYSINGAPQADFALAPQGAGVYTGAFPVPAGSLAAGDVLAYTITATDQATVPNVATSGPHPFTIINALGVALVIDDTVAAVAAADVKYDEDKKPLPAQGADKAAAANLDRWLRDAGYVTHKKTPATVTAADFAGVQFVVVTSGSNTSPVASATLRSLVEGWVSGGGKLLVEGGEVGYDAISSPGYPTFAATALHATAWRSDSAGALQLNLPSHPVATTPHALPASLTVNYSGYGDEDAVTAAADAAVVFDTSGYDGAAGVLCYDNDVMPQAGQIVLLACNVGALADTLAARHLVENSAHWLMAEQGAATASISGFVVQPGSGVAFVPVAGAQVTVGSGHTTTSAADGSFSLPGLYAGTYTLTATFTGLSKYVSTVTLAEGEARSVYAVLRPIVTESFTQSTPRTIPDNNATGVTSTLNVPVNQPVSDITVDINLTHTWIGDLIVELVSPAGTRVRLHNRTGSSADNIVGNYDLTLAVDGPGSLDDFTGQNPFGTWTLFMSDNASSDTGTLQSWTLHVTHALVASAAPEVPVAAFRLLPNRPNPFNPRTEIRFELARSGSPNVAVFDVRGRKVRDLLSDQPLAAGVHTLVWDGRDDAGRDVASGLYVCRVEDGGQRLERKMTLLR